MEYVCGLGVLGGVGHERGNDDVASLDGESHFEFLQQADVLVLESLGDVALREQCPHISNSCVWTDRENKIM